MGSFSIVLFKQQQMPCHDNKAPSWKSGRKTEGFSWTLNDLNIHFVKFVTQLQIWKTSIKTSKACTQIFSLWGCLSDTWFEYSFWEEIILCQICNSASNLKRFLSRHLKNEHWCFPFEGVYQTHDLNIHLGRNSFCVRFVTQLQISKISIKTSKAWTLMFSLWGCLSDTWFEYSFRKETFLCQISNSASNLKHFYQDIERMNIDVFTFWDLIWQTLDIYVGKKQFYFQIFEKPFQILDGKPSSTEAKIS